MLKELCVLWSDGLVLHEAEVDEVDEVDSEDAFHPVVVGGQLWRVAMHHLHNYFMTSF